MAVSTFAQTRAMAFMIEAMRRAHWAAVKHIYAEGLMAGLAAFISSPPSWQTGNTTHLEASRSVATINNEVAGWAALARSVRWYMEALLQDMTLNLASSRARQVSVADEMH